MSKKTKTNAPANPPPPTPLRPKKPVEIPSQLVLEPIEGKRLDTIRAKANNQQFELGGLAKQRYQIEAAERAVLENLRATENEYRQELAKALAARGIDLEKSADKWNFDHATYTFTRHPAPVPAPTPAPAAQPEASDEEE